MVSPAYARLAIGVLGNITSLFLYLSPVPIFVRICKKGSVEQYSATIYLVTFLNCMLWMTYGMPFIHPNSILVSTMAGIGCVIEFVYLFLFVIYTENKKRRVGLVLIILGEMVGVGVTLALLLILTHTTERRSQVIGILGDISGVVMYASLLSDMKQVLITKNVECMPLTISVVSFCDAIIWTTFDILYPLDLYDAIPHGLGCMIGAAQLILYAVYFYKSTKEQVAPMNAPQQDQRAELGLQEVVVVPMEPQKVNSP